MEFRKRFMFAVTPRNLPPSWSLFHDAPREFGEFSIFCMGPHEAPACKSSRTGPRPVFASGTAEAAPERHEVCGTQQGHHPAPLCDSKHAEDTARQ